jgi:hypothetical protein
MSAFKQWVRGDRNRTIAQNIEKIDNKLNFGNHVVPDFWHNLVNYEEILIANNLEIRFSIAINNYYGCVLYYESTTPICDIYEDDYLTYLHLFCKYNIMAYNTDEDSDFYMRGVSHEIFNSNGIQYTKNIKLPIQYNNFIDSVDKAIRENPDYNFAKFNDNSDIKIALKD